MFCLININKFIINEIIIQIYIYSAMIYSTSTCLYKPSIHHGEYKFTDMYDSKSNTFVFYF